MKKHLSRIVSNRLLASIMTAFFFLMGLSALFLSFYEKRSLDRVIDTGMESISGIAQSRMEADFLDNVAIDAVDYEECHGKADLIKGFLEDVYYSYDSERNIIDSNGIIIMSSDPENVGFDMHSDPEADRILEGIMNSSQPYVHDFTISPMNGIYMKYCGTPLGLKEGYYLEGFTEEAFDEYRHGYFISQVRFDNIGSEGYFLLLGEDGLVESSSRGKYDGETMTISEDMKRLPETGKIGRDEVFGVMSYVGMRRDGNELIAAVYPVSVLAEQWRISLLITLFLYLSVFAVLFLVTRLLIADNVVKGVYSLDGSLKAITGGNLDEKADFRESLEFDQLSDGINFMVDRLKGLIKEAEERIDAELALAARIQTSFLPHSFPAFPEIKEFDLFATMTPAKEVGGDLYDFFLTDPDHLAIVIGDVSGKGIPAALFMVVVRDRIRHSVMKYGTDVAKAMSEVNLELIKENDAGLFVTVWLGVLTISTGHLDYVDAGHEYPAISRGGRAYHCAEDVHSVMVAALKKAQYDAGVIQFSPGDTMYLYTDGVTEANDPQGGMFRRERLLAALNRDCSASVKETDDNVRAAIVEFVQDEPRFDDITTLCFRYYGKSREAGTEAGEL